MTNGKTHWKWIIAGLLLGLAVVLSVLLGGCATGTNPPPDMRTGELGGTITKGTVTIDGKQVPCITWAEGAGSGRIGGISCDWANAK